MIIKQRDINLFNKGIEPSYNEEYNKANGIYNRETYLKLKAVKKSQWGMLALPITLRHVKNLYHFV